MCGVAGVVSREGRADVAALRRALAALRHRGPDGEGVFASPGGLAALEHVRLAVVDVEGGAQPLCSEDGSVVAVVNGEIYESGPARRALEARGHRFRTRSDSEILVHLYEEHGDGCLEALRGEFAFLLWDERRQRLLAAVDRFGIRPLCFAEHAAGRPAPSRRRPRRSSPWGCPPPGTRRPSSRPPGCSTRSPAAPSSAASAEIGAGHVCLSSRAASPGRAASRVSRYWDLDYALEGAPEPADPREAVAAVRDALDEAVRIRLVADVPVCFQLSGGVDSSAVVALAAPHLPGPAPCFTVRFDDPAYDELPVAARTAAHLGATLHPVDVPRARLLDALPAAVAQGEGLAINGHIAAKYLLSRAIRDAGYKVVLTGEGSDEVFAGYAHLRRDLLGKGDALAEATTAPPPG